MYLRAKFKQNYFKWFIIKPFFRQSQQLIQFILKGEIIFNRYKDG